MTPLQPPPVFSPVQDKSAVILPIWQAFFVDLAQAVNALAVLTAVVPIANGGTNATAQTTNGVAYFDGTKITTGTVLAFTPSIGTVTLTAPANQNARFIAVAIASNGFGAQFVATSKTTGGVTNTWNAGTGVSGGTNAFEFFNDGFAATQLTLEIGGRCAFGSVVKLKNYTVATLPAGTRGDVAYVTDALAPTFLAALVGGGAVVAPAFYNGAAWVGF